MYERKEEGFKFSKRLSAEAAKLTELSEDKLYEMIGEALFAQELLKDPSKFLGGEWKKTIISKTRRLDSRKKGKVFVNKLRGRMFKKICVEAQACKWEKHVLSDTKGLVEMLAPLIGSIIGFTIPAITISVAIIVTKKGIRKFCKCPPAYGERAQKLQKAEIFAELLEPESDEWQVAYAKDLEEERKLIEAGFEHVRYSERDGVAIYRRRK